MGNPIEVLEAAGKVADAVKEVGEFLNMLLGPAATQMGGIAGDYTAYYRYKNLLKIYDKVVKLHQKRSIEGKTTPVPPRYAIPLIQNAAQEDVEDIQTLWAGLIANSTDPDKKFDPKKIYIEILSSLEPLDVQIILYLNKQNWLLEQEFGGGITIEKLSSSLVVSKGEIEISLQNLNRLGCVFADIDPTEIYHGKSSFGVLVKNKRASYRPSPLGASLLEACEYTS